MPSIGPELPPHFLNRKRPAEDICPDGKSQPKYRINSPVRAIGPSLPAEYQQSSRALSTDIQMNSEKNEESFHYSTLVPDSDKKNYRIVNKISDTDVFSTTTTSMRRILGPAPPPTSQNESDPYLKPISANSNYVESSDSEDDYCPSMPPLLSSLTNPTPFPQEYTTQNSDPPINNSNSPGKLKRAEWMLTPPTSSDWTTRIDPTKLRSRKFASSKDARSSAGRSGVSTIWTETPEQKRKRLENEVLGRTEPAASTSSLSNSMGHSFDTIQNIQLKKEKDAIKEQIQDFNMQNRSKSLIEERKAAQKRGELEIEEDDDPSRRAFDREKDMTSGGRQVSSAKRIELISRIANFGGRFQQGKYL